MRKIQHLILCFAVLLLASCNNNEQTTNNKEVESLTDEVAKLPESTTVSKQLFEVESAYIKFITHAAGQEMIREWRFDKHGERQSEENYLIIMGQKTGDKSIVLDGYKYQWGFDSSEGSKRKFFQTVTDYEKVSKKDIERYGIVKQGYEEFLGKKCLKVSVEKPSKATIWVWNGIPLKTEAVFGGQTVLSEAVEINLETIDETFFKPPGDVIFQEIN
ncbi:MAG: hypothetical protein KKF98_14120 [Bacteroidetes bacterium]|nr:hypothetical protein [Bacteroidota bacterium]